MSRPKVIQVTRSYEPDPCAMLDTLLVLLRAQVRPTSHTENDEAPALPTKPGRGSKEDRRNGNGPE